MNKTANYLTIDVEDYFQVAALKEVVGPHRNWDNYPARVDNNTKTILTLLDKYNVKATFFIVGWIAERFPRLVKDIHAAGHDIGCHSYYHRLIYELTPEEFRQDTKAAKEILEQITGQPVLTYRAPSYSITNKSLWALDILEELGFTHDSSIFPIRHDRYGIPDAPRFKYKIPGHNLIEYPISTSIFIGRKIPVAGGGYFRLFPYWFTKMALKKINRQDGQSFIFYIHPWEIDPGQPRLKGLSTLSKFRHYNNLDQTASRFEQLLTDFSFVPIGQNPAAY
ncbi:FIG004655: Polysaccharide deacetylase [hydrothermal vent metagenome]|uniref:FIG004655: Polysaccharide deacetylase n=1 Tax=hydrothermal vent metagenome TaxID=652676 RepID=A0A3B0UTJ6_9ZZZZ